MVMNITELKKYIDEVVMQRLDHKNLDKDVQYFESIPSTTENLAIYIWQCLKKIMKNPELLYEVKIQETDKNSVIFRGNDRVPVQGRVNYISHEKNISSDSD